MDSDPRAAIEALIPHRPPFLFVDRIVEASPTEVTTEWDISPELFAFQGHYPGEPVLPGVLITEFALQSGAILVYHADPEDQDAPGVPLMTRIEDARFKQIVRPGETLRAVVKLEDRLSQARFMSGKVTSNGKTVARLRFVLAVAPPPAASAPAGSDSEATAGSTDA